MSYITLITTLIEKLNQPTAIAVMASAGIHAVLGLTLPHTPIFSSGERQLPQPVQLLSLTPEDQSRIPELSIPPAPPTIYQQTPIQGGFPPLDRLPTPKIPAKVSQTPVKKQSTTKFQIGKKLPNSNLKTNPGTLKNPVLNQPYHTVNPDELRVVNLPKNNPGIQGRSRPNGVPVFNPNPEATGLFPFNEKNPLPTPPKINPTPTVIREQDREPSIASLGEQGRDVTFDAKNTTNEEARRNALNWLAQNNQPQAEAVIISGNYPKEACTQKLKGSASIGIVVSADGKPMSEPQLLKSAGYAIFDRQAQQDVKSRSFNNQTNQQKLYLVTVEFDYKEESCKAVNRIAPSPSPTGNKPEVPVFTPSPSPTGNKPAISVPIPSPEVNRNKPEVPVFTPSPSPSPTGIKPEVPVLTPSPSPTGNKPEVHQSTPSPEVNRNKPEVSTPTPSPESTGNKPGITVPTTSPSPTGNKPDVPTTILSPQPTRIKPADPVSTPSPQPQASQSTIP